MIALKVRINDEASIIAGAEDLSVVDTSISCMGRLGSLSQPSSSDKPNVFHCHVGGLVSRTSPKAGEHLQWLSRFDLKVGDKVTIEIVETHEVSPYISKQTG